MQAVVFEQTEQNIGQAITHYLLLFNVLLPVQLLVQYYDGVVMRYGFENGHIFEVMANRLTINTILVLLCIQSLGECRDSAKFRVLVVK